MWRDELHTNFVRKIMQMENKDESFGHRIEKLNIKTDRHEDNQKVHTKMLASILDNHKNESDMYITIDEINHKYDEKLEDYLQYTI